MESHISLGAAGQTRRVLDAFRRIVQSLRESSREAEALGLTGAQLFVLHSLEDSPGLCLNDLAERTRTHQSSVSVVATRLVEQGLVERNRAADDGRRVELRLSAEGMRRIQSAPRTAQERLLDAVEALPQATRVRLASVLEALVHELDLGGEHPEMFFQDSARRERKARLAHA
jgi:DNA-binding MarR family transcriptional regulator